MALNSTGITGAIAALSISGVTIKDVTAIPQAVLQRDCPILFPMPGSWIDGGGEASEDETTFGAPSERLWHAHRTFKYVFLHSAVGTGRGNADIYASIVDFTETITETLTALNVSGVDVQTIAHTPIGVIQDAAGNKFQGCFFNITFRERINA